MTSTPTGRPRVLVLFASTHGQTEKIAGHVARRLQERGVDATVRRADGSPPPAADFDGVILAASVHAQRHQAEIERYARRYHLVLTRMPSALLSVSLSAAEDTDGARRDTRRLIDELEDDTGWTPSIALPVAGALRYREYDRATRVIMRLIAAHHGASVATDHDEELTDWDALDAFAGDFAAVLNRRLSRV